MAKEYVKICPYCGAENLNLARFCYSCNKNIANIRADDYMKEVEPKEQGVIGDKDFFEMIEKKAEEEAEAERKMNEAVAAMMISSGFSFEGYRIVKYSGYISGDDAIQIPRGGGFFVNSNNAQKLTEALALIRRRALKELKEAAYALGCNAVVGVDFDYITLEPETATDKGGTLYEPYVICVTANGNAVIIEKE